MYAIATKPRGCGKLRDRGGVYAEMGFSKYGSPLENYLIDPILHCDVDKWGLSPRQPLLYEAQNTMTHVVDWIGESHYPNPADFLEEVRTLGLSRKLELSQDQYKKLTKHSRIFIVLPKAYIVPELLGRTIGTELYPLDKVGYSWDFCPQDKGHYPQSTMKRLNCAGWLWRRTDVGTKSHPDFPKTSRWVTREMPAFTYNAVRSCDEFLDADPDLFKPGFVASFPITRLAVVKDPIGNKHEMKLKKMAGVDPALKVDVTEF